MTIINLYKYSESYGVVITTTPKNETDTPSGYRLIADENKFITQDGENLFSCLDVNATEGWYELDTTNDATEEDYIAALVEMGVSFNEEN